MHLKRLTSELSWVVDTGPLTKSSDISPFVGIRHDRLEELVFSLLNLPLDKWVASVGDNVGYILSGEYQMWSGVRKVADVLDAIDSAQERLLPFLSLEKLSGVWKLTSTVGDPGWRYREIAILLLLGKLSNVPARLDEARTEFCRVADEVCEQFMGFEGRVLKHINAAVRDEQD